MGLRIWRVAEAGVTAISLRDAVPPPLVAPALLLGRSHRGIGAVQPK